MTETVKLTLEVPRSVWDCLVYYMRHTIHWCGNEMVERAAADYVLHMVKSYLEAEADHPTDAEDEIKRVMRAEHLPNLS